METRLRTLDKFKRYIAEASKNVRGNGWGTPPKRSDKTTLNN
jgi:hypothetical protein